MEIITEPVKLLKRKTAGKIFNSQEVDLLQKSLNSSLIPLWKEVDGMLSSDNITLFLSELKSLATLISWPELNDYISDLDLAILSFNFESIQKLIDDFQYFIDQSIKE